MNEIEEDNNSVRTKRTGIPIFHKFATRPKVILSGILIYVGLGIAILFSSDMGPSYFIEKFGPIMLGVCIAIPGFIMISGEMSKLTKLRREDKFIDVDDSRDNESQIFEKKYSTS